MYGAYAARSAARTPGNSDKGANESEKVQIFSLPLYRYFLKKKSPKQVCSFHNSR